MNRRPGFTLVEMLVVITVITALAGMIIAGIPAIQAHGQRAGCVAMLQQYGTALNAYGLDWNGKIPRVDIFNGTTSVLFDRYLQTGRPLPLDNNSTLLKCPAYFERAPTSGTKSRAPAYNTALGDYAGALGINQVSGQMALLFCAGIDGRSGLSSSSLSRVTAADWDRTPQFPHSVKTSDTVLGTTWTSGKCNVLHLGGHITTRAPACVSTPTGLTMTVTSPSDSTIPLGTLTGDALYDVFWYGQRR